MFKRIFVEDWALCVPIISFCIFFTVFVAVTIRALRIGKSERERLGRRGAHEERAHEAAEQGEEESFHHGGAILNGLA